MRLISNNLEKNMKPIRSGINHVDRNVFGNNLPPLISLLKTEHMNLGM